MELTQLILIAVLGLASYRATRFLLFDTLIEGIRSRWYTFLVNRRRPAIFWQKLLDLTTCTWCSGWWITTLIYSLFIKTAPWNFGIYEAVTLLAIAGVQGLVHAFEPGDEDH